MTELFQNWVALLLANPAFLALVPEKNIFVGPVDIAYEKQDELLYPQIRFSLVNETQRTVPLHTRDTTIQVDILGRVSQLQVQEIYEQLVEVLAYKEADQGDTHIFWQRLEGARDFYEQDRRVWHRSVDFIAWTIK